MAVFVFPWLPVRHQTTYITAWSRRVVNIFHIQVVFINPNNFPPSGGFSVVSNHVSWIDIQVISTFASCRFITTSEIRAWPVIGRMVEASGALFLDMKHIRQSTREVTQQMAALLRAGETLGFFPEATSTEGLAVLPFKANLFQASVDSQTPVYPIAIQYKDRSGKLSSAAGFHGDMTLLTCMRNILSHAPLTAEVRFLTPLPVMSNRKEMCRACESQIKAVFQL